MGDTSGCLPTSDNLAVYLQGVSVTTSSFLTSEYFVTGSLPSASKNKRVWQFITQGTITGPDNATITLDYTQASENCPTYNITFEGALNGTLTIHNQVFSANKYMSYALSLTNPYVLYLTIKIPKRIQECYGATTPQAYFLNVYVNDSSCSVTNTINYFKTSTSLEPNVPASYFNDNSSVTLNNTLLFFTQLTETSSQAYQLVIEIFGVNPSSTYCWEFENIANGTTYYNEIVFINLTGILPPASYGLNSNVTAATAVEITGDAYVENNSGSRVCFYVDSTNSTSELVNYISFIWTGSTFTVSGSNNAGTQSC